MISTFGSFSTVKLGIRSSQQGLQITGNNITNINTDGYTRQRINQQSLYHGTADRYSVSTDVRMGFGALVTSVSQIRDPFLDIRYRNEASNVGFYDEKLANLEELKAVLDEVSKDGVHTAFEDIRTQLQNLANNPTDKVNDRLVRSACQKLVSLLNKYSADLNTQKENSLQGFNKNVGEVNKILTQIRDLNTEIRNSQIHGDPALEMLDNRNMLIDKLSEMTKIKVTYSEEKIGGGIVVDKLTIELDAPNQDPANRPILIDGEFANKLEIQPLGQDGTPDITAENYQVNLGGLTNIKGDTPIIAQIKEQMDALNSLTHSMQGINQQLAGVNQQVTAWANSLAPNFTQNDFNKTVTPPAIDSPYDTKLKGLKKDIDDARKALEQKPNDPTLKKNLKDAQDKLAAFNRFDQQKQALDNRKADLTRNFNFKFEALERSMNGFDPSLTLTQTTNTDGTISVEITGGTPGLNHNLIDGTNPTNPPLKFGMQDNTAGNPPGTLDLQLGGTKFGEKTQAQLDAAANKLDVREDQWYGVMRADLEYLNGKGEFGNPVTKIRGIAYYQRSLDSLAQSFAETMNKLNEDPKTAHADTLFDAGDPQNPNKKITASNISISREWENGTVKITTSTDSAGGSGDNSNVHNLISAINGNQKFYVVDKDGNQLDANGNVIPNPPAGGAPAPDPVEIFTGSFEGMFTNMSAILGSDMSATSIMLNTAAISANERAVARDNLSSVDLNEEGINLVQYQKSFTAACRVMTTLDEMLDTLLNAKR